MANRLTITNCLAAICCTAPCCIAGPTPSAATSAAAPTGKPQDKSLALGQAAIALNAGDALAHENVAEAYVGAGRTAQAEWRKVLTLEDDRLKAMAKDYLRKYP